MTSDRHLAILRVFGERISLSEAVAAAIVLAVTVLIAVGTRTAILRYSDKQGNAHRGTWYTVSRIVTYTVLVIGVLIAISALGLPLSRFAFLAGALSVGLGFGLQTIFSNFVSGLILLFDKSLRVGDFVELESGVTGEVRDIRIRATRVVTRDNIDILVPNSEFIAGQVVNWTHGEASRRLRVPFGVAYGTDKELVKQAALEAAAEVPFTREETGPRRPQVWLVEFGDSSLNFELAVWLTDEATTRPGAVNAAYNWALHSALERHGIEIPFPQRDINVRQLFGLDEHSARRALRLADPSADDDTADEDATSRHGASSTMAVVPPTGNDAADEVSAAAHETGDERD